MEASKVHGLLTVSLDANEQCCSDHRCCVDAMTREITTKDDAGQPAWHTRYYHKQVYAQLSGPRCRGILDVKPMRQGEEIWVGASRGCWWWNTSRCEVWCRVQRRNVAHEPSSAPIAPGAAR